MLTGRFGNTTSRPYIEALVTIPRLGVAAVSISFLVDTGASRSMIGPIDRVTMGIDLADLAAEEIPVDGIGGVEHCAEEIDAYVVFASDDGQSRHYYQTSLLISRREVDESELTEDATAVHRLPSLLGRDILHRWEMHYAPHEPDPSLSFTVISDDLTLASDPEER